MSWPPSSLCQLLSAAMSSHDDIFTNEYLHSYYMPYHYTSTQRLQDYLPSSFDSDRSDTLSYHTNDLSHGRPSHEDLNVGGDLSNPCTHYLQMSSPRLLPSMDSVLNGMDRQTWDMQQHPLNSPPVYNLAQDTWIPELDSGEDGCQATLMSPHGFAAGASVPMSYCDTTSYSGYSAKAAPLIFPMQDVWSGSRFFPDFVDPRGTEMQLMDSSAIRTEGQWGNTSSKDFSQSGHFYQEEIYPVPAHYDALSISGSGTCESTSRTSQDFATLTRDVQKQKYPCPELGCNVEFSLRSDLKRHLRTIHREAGKGYRCAVEGCPKFGKVWNRLDSFKKHVEKLHENADVADLVRKSSKKVTDLPISVTTPGMMSRRSVFDGDRGSTLSRSFH